MKYIKTFEMNQENQIIPHMQDILLDLEEMGYNSNVVQDKIVKGRNDWTGNFSSTPLRKVYGQEFIYYTEDVIMSRGDQIYHKEEVILVTISRLSYIKVSSTSAYKSHWEEVDSELLTKLNMISKRVKGILDLDLYGVMAGWYSLGKAEHPDYLNTPHYGFNVVSDFYMIAFE